MVDVKAFQLETPISKTAVNLFTRATLQTQESEDKPETPSGKKNGKRDSAGYTQVRLCRSCQHRYLISELTHQMVQRSRGEDMTLGIQTNSTQQSSNMYEQYRVCNTCYALYQQIQELKHVQAQFAAALGLLQDAPLQMIVWSSDEKTPPPVKSLNPLDYAAPELPAPRDKEEQTPLNFRSMNRFNLLLILYELVEIETDLDVSKPFSLEFKIHHHTMRYKLNSSRTLRAGLQIVPLHIIRLFHVFCDGREGLVEFLRW